jgi:glutamine amidotransferase
VITLVDYGAGNVHSVAKALQAVGADVHLTDGARDLQNADKIVLPGVGAFGDCMAALRERGLEEPIAQSVAEGRPLLGICVGMQVLFQWGEELGLHRGLGLLPGRVVRFPAHITSQGHKVPHTGWNQLRVLRPTLLFDGIQDGAWAYFNQAYYCAAGDEDVSVLTEHGFPFPAAVQRGALCGVQFHPEKSQHVGLRVLRNFVQVVE